MELQNLYNFLSGLPAILGATCFIIFHIIQKNAESDPVIIAIINKLRFIAPKKILKYENLKGIQKLYAVNQDQTIQTLLNDQDANCLNNVLRHRFITKIIVYIISSILLIISLILFYYTISKEKPLQITGVHLNSSNSDDEGLAVDTDSIELTWTSSGTPKDIRICLENARTGRKTDIKRINSNEGRMIFTSTNFRLKSYQAILEKRQPGEINYVRALFYLDNGIFPSQEFKLYVGVVILVLAEKPNKIRILPIVDNSILSNFWFKFTLVLFKNDSDNTSITYKSPKYKTDFLLEVNNPNEMNWTNFIFYCESDKSHIDDKLIRYFIELGEFTGKEFELPPVFDN